MRNGRVRRTYYAFKYARYGLTAVAILISADAVFVAMNWPFTRQREIESLEHFAQSEVTIRRFEAQFLPYPGFDATDIVFTRRANGRSISLARVAGMQCRSTWLNVVTYTHRAWRFDLQGVHVVIPERVPPAMRMFPNKEEETTVENLSADQASLDVQGSRFTFPRLRLSNIAKGKRIGYDITAQIPKPFSLVAARGRMGPFQRGQQRTLPLSGTFELRNGALESFENLVGTLSGRGKYNGVLGDLSVSGAAYVKGFHLRNVHHPVDISSEYNITADCQHGTVRIRQVTANFANTIARGSGSVTEKVLQLQIESIKARLEDLLALVVTAPQPPAAGAIQFRSAITLPPGNAEFLRRVQMGGDFHVIDGWFLRAESQHKLNELSWRARSRREKKGRDGLHFPDVRAELHANFSDKSGIATFSEIMFQIPDAVAKLSGTFNLLSKGIALRGRLSIHASLSAAAGGVKSLLLLPLDPLFKNGAAGAVVGVTVSGTYSHPIFKASLRKHR